MNKLLECKEVHRDILLMYLKQEAVRNTFLIGDIINYGFDNEIQSVWMDYEEEQCNAVYLWFCNNLLIYSHKDQLNAQSLTYVLKMKQLDQVMAKRVHLQQISDIQDGYTMKSKSLLAYYGEVNDQAITSYPYTYRTASITDVDNIYDFLQSGELAPLYRSKSMIENRIRTGDGSHLLIEQDARLVAQINSAASTPYSTMIGGLFTEESHRNQDMASYLVQCLCKEIIGSNRIPCLISGQTVEHNLFYKLGFKEVEEFTTLELSE